MMGGFMSVAHLIFSFIVKIYIQPKIANIFNTIIKFEPIPDKHFQKNLSKDNLKMNNSNLMLNSSFKNISVDENNYSDIRKINNYVSVEKNSSPDLLNVEVLITTIKNILNKIFS